MNEEIEKDKKFVPNGAATRVAIAGKLITRRDRMALQEKSPLDYDLVICRYITRNGKRIYPKNKRFFRFWVKKKPVTAK